ncbi:hypothetical protein AV530_015561 [Patagioenas fasciata monilis]|uniref:Uncharacterized protein n=1 Tax=Patagioenas fasciata monilis TaxID=372326 RepID=A0A1V4KHY5_PATFA|nr:hypothetical protein AV530_015561 [Patagioenas fasciata monilis]
MILTEDEASWADTKIRIRLSLLEQNLHALKTQKRKQSKIWTLLYSCGEFCTLYVWLKVHVGDVTKTRDGTTQGCWCLGPDPGQIRYYVLMLALVAYFFLHNEKRTCRNVNNFLRKENSTSSPDP